MTTGKPIVVINFKTCKEGSNGNALALAKKIEYVQAAAGDFDIILAVQPQDIYRIKKETNLTVFAQHVDAIYYGGNTGSICPEGIKDAGASGTLLNHPDKTLPKGVIEK